MSSANSKYRVSKSTNPFNNNDHPTASRASPIMVNSDIMILPGSRQGYPFDCEDNNYTNNNKSNKNNASSTLGRSTSTGAYRQQRSNNDHEMQERKLVMSPSIDSMSTVIASRSNSKGNNYYPASHRPKGASKLTLTGDSLENLSAAGSKANLIYSKPNTTHSKNEHAKTGIPGKNGEEPETDMFNFVHIMLNMPEEPTWKEVITKLFKVLAVMAISYFGLMSLYYAAEFKSDSYMSNFDVLVVDLDKGLIGSNFLNFTTLANAKAGQLNWSIKSSDLYPNISVISEEVSKGNYWGAIIIQPNASVNLMNAFSIPLPDYDPTGAFAFIYDGGRDPLVVKPYIVASMYTQFIVFTGVFNPAWIKFILAYSEQGNFTIDPLQNAPQVLGTPVAFEDIDLHPVTSTIITSATSVAYIWIFLVAGGSTYLVTHVVQPMTRHVSVFRTMIYMLLPLMMFLITMSMAYSALLPTFGVPFPDGVPQFFKLFGGMLLLQCSVSAMVLFLIFLIPVVYIPTFTITFVILNVIAVFNPTQLMPGFYRWVYAMPFLNAVQMARFVLMGSYNRLQYNIPVLCAWIMVPIILMPFAIARQKRLAKEARIREEEEKFEEEFRLRKQRQMRLRLADQERDQESEYVADQEIESSEMSDERYVVEDDRDIRRMDDRDIRRIDDRDTRRTDDRDTRRTDDRDTRRMDDRDSYGFVKRSNSNSESYYNNNEYEELHRRHTSNQGRPSESNPSSPRRSRRSREPFPNDPK
ncbi:hypothetical protein BGZ80_005882 [Entomortierella chlamydospora]|uniref:DUF3533 domain-containing protein n=1 Tax=Entomortierella chlamydospora TaxID=101097 RepID=A0A9P6N3T0_9FUNG|nr:hypothetical protein BGZ79_002285 [Entomortierella chlamydospora]KAG0024117.1 hypothetical protein BGZ80_005882 [Entomortierella chlamydospora]